MNIPTMVTLVSITLATACRPSDFDDVLSRAPTVIDDGGTSADASTITDAGVQDASVAGDAGTPAPTGVCPQGAFCDDFEAAGLRPDDLPPRDGWDWYESAGNGQASLVVRGEGSMLSRAFESSVGGATPAHGARLVHQLPHDVASVHVELDFTPTLAFDGMGSEIHILRFQQDARVTQDGELKTPYPGVSIIARADGLVVMVENQLTSYQKLPDAPILDGALRGTVHISLDLTLGAAGSIRIAIGDRVYQRAPVALQSQVVTNSYVQVGLYSTGVPGSSALYDNVVIASKTE